MNEYQKQAQDWCTRHGITIDARYIGHGKHFDDDKDTRDIYQITITNRRKVPLRAYSFRFGQSIANSAKPRKDRPGMTPSKAPTEYDIIATLQKYDPGTHADFCGSFGIDPDSRKGLDLYLSVQQEFTGFAHVCASPEALAEAQEIN